MSKILNNDNNAYKNNAHKNNTKAGERAMTQII